MKRFYLFTLLLALMIANGNRLQGQATLHLEHLPQSEELNYDIYYNWGKLWKKAGEGRFVMKPDYYDGKPAHLINLYGRTLSFVETFFPVRDTLQAYALIDGFVPQYYTKRIHEGGYKATDILRYSYKGATTTVSIREIGNRGGIEDTVISRETPVYDMLTVFYYLRSIELQKAKPNEVFPVEVATGRHIYKLKFRYLGTEEIVNRSTQKKHICFKVQMVFENTHGKVDDDTMIAYVRDDDARTPVQLEAKLRIGYMKAVIRE